MSALPNNKNKVKLQQPNNLNNKGLNNASILNTKNLPKPVNTSMGDGSNQGIAQVSSSTLANGTNNNQGISNDYIKGIARDFSKTSSVKEKLALAKWLNKFAATAGGTKTVSLNTSKNPPSAQSSAANKSDATPKVGDANYKNPKIRTYGEANNMTDEQVNAQENQANVLFNQLGNKSFISDQNMQKAKAIADQNQRSRQQWEAREAKGLNNLSREDYDRLSKEKVTYYDKDGNAREYAKYYGGYTQNGGFLNEMKMPKGMYRTKEEYERAKAEQAKNKAQPATPAAGQGTPKPETGTPAATGTTPTVTGQGTGQGNTPPAGQTNNQPNGENDDLKDKDLGVLLSSTRQRLNDSQFNEWRAQEFPRIADEYTRRINDTLTKDPRYLSVLKPLVNKFPNAFGIDNGKFIIKNPNIIPVLSSSHYNGLIQGIMNNTLGFKTPPANPAQPQQ